MVPGLIACNIIHLGRSKRLLTVVGDAIVIDVTVVVGFSADKQEQAADKVAAGLPEAQDGGVGANAAVATFRLTFGPVKV